MIYSEYKKASLRHLDTCLHICEHYSYIKNKSKQKNVLIDTYYLTGYVFECIFSYTIFSLVGYNKFKSVYKLNNDNSCGLVFGRHFRTHNLTWKIDYISKNGGSGLSYITILNGTPRPVLLKKWSATCRYTLNFELSYEEVEEFVLLAKDTVEKIRIHITKD